MKEKIVNIAYEKGFINSGDLDVFDGSKPNDYYLWMCLLQKWLRVERYIHVEIKNLSFNCLQGTVKRYEGDKATELSIIMLSAGNMEKTHEELLNQVLIEGLNQIEDDRQRNTLNRRKQKEV